MCIYIYIYIYIYMFVFWYKEGLTESYHSFVIKFGLSPPKKFCFLLHWKSFKNDEECILFYLQGILRQIFCIDIKTHIDRKWKIMQNLFKKTFFSKCLSFYWPFFIDIIIPVISSTHIACDSTEKNYFFFL